jgi:hypothetical protein
MAVGDRIQQCAYAHHSDEMDAALRELVGDPRGVVWGPMAMLDRRTGRELLDLLDDRITLLGLDP